MNSVDSSHVKSLFINLQVEIVHCGTVQRVLLSIYTQGLSPSCHLDEDYWQFLSIKDRFSGKEDHETSRKIVLNTVLVISVSV